MSITVVTSSGYVSVNGRSFSGLDLSAIPSGVQKIKWDGVSGSVTTSTGKSAIRSFVEYQFVVDIWAAAKNNCNPSQTIEERIDALIALYELERNKLKLAWLAAEISDGVDEAARKAAIESELIALDGQLDEDILAIIMEE